MASVTGGVSLTAGERTTLAGVIWNILTSALTTVGSIGKLLVDNINATISSRSTYAGTDTPGTTTLLARVPTDPADASDIAASFTTVNGKLDTISGAVDTEVAAIKTTTDKLNTALEVDGPVWRYTVNALEQAPSGGSGGASAGEIADAVWNEPMADTLRAAQPVRLLMELVLPEIPGQAACREAMARERRERLSVII